MANRIFPDPAEAGHYEWQYPGLPPVSLRFNELLHSVRVQTGEERRVYLLESSHFPSLKVALYSEYGLRIGSCTFDDSRRLRGSLRWDDQKFRFRSEEALLHLTNAAQQEFTYHWELPEDTAREVCACILLMLACQSLLPSPKMETPIRTA